MNNFEQHLTEVLLNEGLKSTLKKAKRRVKAWWRGEPQPGAPGTPEHDAKELLRMQQDREDYQKGWDRGEEYLRNRKSSK